MNTGGGAAGLLDAPQAAEAPKPKRFREPQKFLPVAFMAATICGLWAMYVFWHCVPLLQLDAVHGHVDTRARFRGTVELIAFHWFTALLLYCYVMSILVHPGEIPSQDPQWEWLPQHSHSVPENLPMSLQEMKKSGERRHCKWCGKYKPDRCHHCRVCKKCILKMDHHCPWIYNCVGFWNYKYFFLLLVYSGLDCHLIAWTMAESVRSSMSGPAPFSTMFALLFGETLAALLAAFLSLFLAFHVWLMAKAMTTIEFCEKLLPTGGGTNPGHASAYDFGPVGNISASLGENPLLWLVPCVQPPGDGLSFAPAVVQARLARTLEADRGTTATLLHKAQQRYGTVDGHNAPSTWA
mmetsp:Transcript_5761/g.16378  ORF Transcript_5761/g.16378 Transcript_5761/m.16378 type:complete len:352 (+) Transcript_5761:158-1213(+)